MGFHAVISHLPVLWHLSLSVFFFLLSFNLTFFDWHLSLGKINDPSVCVCVLSLQACVLVSMYMRVHKCVLCSLHALSVEHALSQTCSQPNANWSGSGPAGIEVGVSIDKAVNEVIGRINRGPKGTMSISACWSVSLSKDAGMGVRGDRVQWE